MRSAVLIRCACGHRLLCKVRSEGERLGMLVFFDADGANETFLGRITECPGCGDRLGAEVLIPRKQTE